MMAGELDGAEETLYRELRLEGVTERKAKVTREKESIKTRLGGRRHLQNRNYSCC